MLLIYRNIILLQIKEKHATTSTSRTTTKVHPSLKNKRGSRGRNLNSVPKQLSLYYG